MIEPGEHGSLTQLSKVHMGSYKETEKASMGSASVCTRFYGCMLWLLLLCACETPNTGNRCFSGSFVWSFS